MDDVKRGKIQAHTRQEEKVLLFRGQKGRWKEEKNTFLTHPNEL